jgi:hypothetical protein
MRQKGIKGEVNANCKVIMVPNILGSNGAYYEDNGDDIIDSTSNDDNGNGKDDHIMSE